MFSERSSYRGTQEARGNGSNAGEDYWKYMIEADKKPTQQFHFLLNAIAKYISNHLAPLDDQKLSPIKLASFYKAVGGNYDTLFVDMPHPSISFIYQSIGCQHTLQPTVNDFAEPSIPALTARGFIRWETIETLLQPEEHVPFLQYAVRNFDLKHPETGEPYPKDLPAHVFPLVADRDIEQWHTSCSKKLRERASATDHIHKKPHVPPRPDIKSGFSHVPRHEVPLRSPRPSVHEEADYFTSKPIPSHAPENASNLRPPQSRSAGHRHSPFEDLPPDSQPARSRRNSVPEDRRYPRSTLPKSRLPSPLHSKMSPERNGSYQTNYSYAGKNSRTFDSRRRATSSLDSTSSSSEDNHPHHRTMEPSRTVRADERQRQNFASKHRYGSATPRNEATMLYARNPRLDHIVSPTLDRKGRKLDSGNVSRSASRGSTYEQDYRNKVNPRISLDGQPDYSDHFDGRERNGDKPRPADRPQLSSMRSGSHDGTHGGNFERRDRDRLDRFRDRAETDRDERDRKVEEKTKPKRRWW